MKQRLNKNKLEIYRIYHGQLISPDKRENLKIHRSLNVPTVDSLIVQHIQSNAQIL